jgi:hypothetical protein
MKLWLLRLIDENAETDNPWNPWYDKCFGFVICAENQKEARELAHNDAGDENRGEFLRQKIADTKGPWLDPKYSTCIELTAGDTSIIIMKDMQSA